MELKERFNRQIGDYVIIENHLQNLPYSVRMAGEDEYLSHWDSVTDAVKAIIEYQKTK